MSIFLSQNCYLKHHYIFKGCGVLSPKVRAEWLSLSRIELVIDESEHHTHNGLYNGGSIIYCIETE